MKRPLIITTFLAAGALAPASAATIMLLPPTPYLRFTDSPFHAAAAAGDLLKFGDQFCNNPASGLPNGLGVHDNFNDDEDCLSPWVRLTSGRFSLFGAAVDEDNGVQGDPGGWSIVGDGLGQQPVIEFTFVTTSDSRFPSWGGFVITGVSYEPIVMADILGAGNTILASINLSASIPPLGMFEAPVNNDRFIGFLSDTPVYGIRITGTALLDDLTYGYGTPIPEPTPSLFGLSLLLSLASRRRSDRSAC